MGNESKNFWISIGLALFAVFLIYGYTEEKKAEYDKIYGTTKRIIVAKENINEMQTIYDNMVEVIDRPEEFVDADSISVIEEVIGSVAAVPIKKGQQILKNNLLTPGPDTGIAQQVAPTKRAVTLPVDEIRGVAKLIRPGDRIDIIAAIDIGKGLSVKREVMTVMQDVIVLATGVSVVNNIPRLFELDSSGKNITQTSLTGDIKYTTITIETTPKEAQDLIYLISTSPGNIFYTLRNPNDRTIGARLPSSTLESVSGMPTMDTAPAAQIQR